MIKSKYLTERKKQEREQVIKLYKQGLSVRHIGTMINKSRQYIWLIVRGLNNDKYLTSDKSLVIDK